MARAQYIADRAKRAALDAQNDKREIIVKDKSREARRVIRAMERKGYVLADVRAADGGDSAQSGASLLWEMGQERKARRRGIVARIWRFIWRCALWFVFIAVVWNLSK